MRRQSHSVAETEAVAGELAERLAGRFDGRLGAGACVALHGDLGAGKTQFVRGLVRALGGDATDVSSPTYVLLNVYQSCRPTVYHLDAYRVHGEDDFEQIGFGELLEQGGIVVVEWPDRVAGLIPADAVHVTITATGRNRRVIDVGI